MYEYKISYTIMIHLIWGLFIFALPYSGLTYALNVHHHKITDFAISVSVDDDQVKLKCKENCSWKELTFSHPEQEASQAINQDGMTSYSENRKDDSEFLFELYLEEGTVHLSCKQGCAWKELSFDKPTEGTAQNIDHNGMTGMSTNE